MIELFTRFTVTAPAGLISDAGIAQITALLSRTDVQSDEWKALNPTTTNRYLPLLPSDWEWQWVILKGEYAGTLPKRLASYFFKKHGLKCPAAFLSAVGNIARAHTNESTVYHFEFVNVIDWEDGDFGDAGSCYWGDHAGAREMLETNGGLAICFYDDRDNGFARAWVVPVGTYHVVFNGYGFEGNPTLTIARVLALFLSVTYKHIGVLNNGYSNGTLWINGATGYAVGALADIEHVSDHDFGWHEINRLSCYHCGTTMDENDSYRGADDNDYCQNCFYDLFDTCYHCSGTYWNDDMTYVGDEVVCDYCLNKNYTACENCGDYVRNHHAQEHNGNNYCADCYSELETKDDD